VRGNEAGGVAPARRRHALNHGAEQRLERGSGRVGTAGCVVDLDRRDRATGDEDAPRFAQDLGRVSHVLEEPHHPHVVERLVGKRERSRVSLDQGGLDSGSLEVPAGERELLRLDVDAVQDDPGELLAENRQHRADTATDLEQPRPRLERGAVRDQSVPPVFRLLDEAFLLTGAVAVHVVSHETPTATDDSAASKRSLDARSEE